jgi:uncharacterized protein (TIGR02270 family)
MKVIDSIVSQHAEETALLWMLRRAAVTSSNYGLGDLAKLDGRIEAHLDGLRVAGEAGWRFCEAQLLRGEAGEVFAASIMGFESGQPERIGRVLAVVQEAPETVEGVVSALGWLALDVALPHITALLNDEAPGCRQVGVAAPAVHRWHPGGFLGRFAIGAPHAVRSRVLRWAGEVGDREMSQDLLHALSDPDEDCRFAAAWSGALLRLPACVAMLQTIGESGSRRAAEAADLAVRCIDLDAAVSWQGKLASDGASARLAIQTAGSIGDPSLVPWLISRMDHPALARVAGEAFTMITGSDLAYRDLDRRPPGDYDAGPSDDPADDRVSLDPDEDLPWPEMTSVQRWWKSNGSTFQGGVRYLLGKPLADDWLKVVLRDGRQRQRAAAALEIALRNPGQSLFEVRAPGFRQQQEIGRGEVIR